MAQLKRFKHDVGKTLRKILKPVQNTEQTTCNEEFLSLYNDKNLKVLILLASKFVSFVQYSHDFCEIVKSASPFYFDNPDFLLVTFIRKTSDKEVTELAKKQAHCSVY